MVFLFDFSLKIGILQLESANGDERMNHKKPMPELFDELIQDGYLAQSNIHSTADGFFVANHRLVQLGGGYLYAVPARGGYIYGVFTMADQEGIRPGVVISYAAIDPHTLHPRTLSHRGIKAYFRRSRAKGAELIAQIYARYIAQEEKIPLPYYYEMYSGGEDGGLSRSVEAINREAGYGVCDMHNIYIRDREDLSVFEERAILLTHTGCTSLRDFATKVRRCAGLISANNTADVSVASKKNRKSAK